MRDVLEVLFDLTPPTQEQMRELVADLGEEERHLLLDHGEGGGGAVYLPPVRTAFIQGRRKV